MTQGLTDPQREVLADLLAEKDPSAGTPVRDYIHELVRAVDRRLASPQQDGRKRPTMGALRRALLQVQHYLDRMHVTNERMRHTFARKGLVGFEQLPDPSSSPDQIISPNQVSILYLGGYDQLTQCTIVSILMEGLFEHRASLSNRIPPFATFIEEAHQFIPSSREGTEDAPSVDTLRKVITEGRKFGTASC